MVVLSSCICAGCGLFARFLLGKENQFRVIAVMMQTTCAKQAAPDALSSHVRIQPPEFECVFLFAASGLRI